MRPPQSGWRPALVLVFLAGGIAATHAQPAPEPAAAPTTNAPAPKIQFANPSPDFGQVDSGQTVKHDFWFTNAGAALLQIKEVRTSCGCTAAGEWDKNVDPGKSGRIPIQFATYGYGGAVSKSVTVVCNDPIQSNLVLTLKGTVFKPIDLSPPYAVFNVAPDYQTNETQVLRIINHLDEAITLSDLQGSNALLNVELSTVKPGKEFELRVTLKPPLPPNSHSSLITMKSSSARMSNIAVTAYIMLKPLIGVTPNQLMLPPGPLTNKVEYTITIQNNSTNDVALSEPKVNAEGVTLDLRTVHPGRFFNLTVAFPAGFLAQPGQPLEVALKSDHPSVPQLKVPVFQMPAPATTAQPPAGTPPPATTGASVPPPPPPQDVPDVKPALQRIPTRGPPPAVAAQK